MTDHVFPQPTGVAVDGGRVVAQINAGGLSKRELFAAMAMQGMCADSTCKMPVEQYADCAVRFADALIEALEEGR